MSILEDRPVTSGQAHLPAQLDALLDKAPHARATVLRDRLNAELPVLHDRLVRLYGCNPNFSQWLNQVVIHAVELALARPDDLWSLDIQRETNPNWHVHGGLGYCAYVDKFAGNLAGIHQRIPHLQELGVT